MRVSKLFCLKGLDPEPLKLFRTPLLCAENVANKASMFPACGEICPMGMRLPGNGVRPAPVFGSPVVGSKTCPPPETPAVRYSLRSQKPVVFVAGLQVLTTVGVGIVSRWVIPA